MKTILLIIVLLVTGLGTTLYAQPSKRLSDVFTGVSKRVLVAAHRGDWRNAPENSVQGLTNCIRMGVDITEFDLQQTRDGQLIILHDKTLDRSTTGKGRPEDQSWAAIAQYNLRSGTGHPTRHRIPLFSDMLLAAKGKIIVNIDKGYEYYDKVLQALQEQRMVGEAILNIYGLPFDSLQSQHGPIPQELALQVIVHAEDPQAEKVIDSYRGHARTIVQLLFATDTVKLLPLLTGAGRRMAIWYNALWPEQNGGHDDDRAMEEGEPEESWGWLIGHKACIIQTDRPAALLMYLRGKQLHD